MQGVKKDTKIKKELIDFFHKQINQSQQGYLGSRDWHHAIMLF